MSDQTEQDAQLILEVLAEWSFKEEDSGAGAHIVTTAELKEKLEIPLDRFDTAIEHLLELAYISLPGCVAGSGVSCEDIELEPAGLEAYERLKIESAEDYRPQPVHYDVFLSHSSLDSKLASDIKKLLEANQINVFSAPSSLTRGKWNNQVEEALQNSSTIWVLLTPKALGDSTAINHELGYFYGYNHGKGEDQKGRNCRFLYMKGANHSGLYSRFQGIRVDSFDDPVLVAQIITREMNREFILHEDWVTAVGPQEPEGVTGQPDMNQPVVGITRRAYGPGTTEVVIWLQNVIHETIHHVSVLMAHPEVKVVAIDGCFAIIPSYPYPLKFRLRNREQVLEDIPEVMTDDWGRRFNVMPGPAAPEGKIPLLITYESKGGRAFAAVFYCTISHNSEGYPNIEIDPPVPVEWREEFIAIEQPVL